MRELTISPDADLGDVRPRKARGKKGAPALEASPQRWRMARATIFKGIVWGGFALLMGGIVLNAAFNQKGHHPAPILGMPQPVAAAAPPAPRPPVQAAAEAPAPQSATAAPSEQAEPQVTGSVAPADDIGAVLSGNSSPAKPKHAAAKPHANPPHGAVASKPAANPHVASADRNRLTSLFTAAAKGH